MQITKHQENKFPYSSVAKRALLQVKLPLGAVAFPAADGSRLAAGDKYFFYQCSCRGQVLVLLIYLQGTSTAETLLWRQR